MTILYFLSGVLTPVILGLIASVLAYYFQIFVNNSIPFVLGIPLILGFKYKKKNASFFYGTITGVLLTAGLIVLVFFHLIKTQNSIA